MESGAHIDTATRLAVDRTRLAHERTLMAWVRTAVSMITFGFTIYKFFDLEAANRPVPRASSLGPHEFALVMIAIGLVALLLSTAQHLQSMRALRAQYGRVVPVSIAAIVAGLFAILGGVALLSVLRHW